jgi:hypothetical protein
MRRVIIFGGPSLPRRSYPPCVECRPPAERGDLSSLVSETGSVVVLLDGVFFHRPTPTHLDILRLLQAGVFTVGAASMGALRAAEFRDYGMVGIGVVYRAILAGIVTDDSEVAVGLSPYDFSATTIALINVRRLLSIARSEGIDKGDALRAFHIAQDIHFLNRTREILQRNWSRLLAGSHLSRLLGDERIDLKKRDANRAIDYALSHLSGQTLEPSEFDPAQEIWCDEGAPSNLERV